MAPEADTANTRSLAPIQPGSRWPLAVVTGIGAPLPQMAVRISPATPLTPMPSVTIARGRPSAATAPTPASAASRRPVRIWAAAEATAGSMPEGSAATR